MKTGSFIWLCIGAGFCAFILGVIIYTKSGSSYFPEIEWDNSIGILYEDIEYGVQPLQKYDLIVPRDTTRDGYGMVVYLHAGGFTLGDKMEDRSILQYFNSKGYIAVGVNYTLRTDDNESSVYDMSIEVKEGINAACKKAIELGYPIDGIAIGGGSAGASLAMIAAFRDAESFPAPVAFCLTMVGASTFEQSAWFPQNADYNDPETLYTASVWCSTLSGDDVTPEMIIDGSYRASIDKVSAYTMVTDSTCPVIGAYGELDKLVPIQTLPYLEDALIKHNIKHDIFRFPNSGHALQHDKKILKQFADKLEEYLQTYLPIL